ncbi:l-asparaginase II domain-containing protein [Hirsutella rhossiliensis]|uniref:L-asparaginase II domain-containing protein n=1 Tax=Hirsutella rhossiliensis TaxID=111463 RepID=A0A9P8SNZ4_9HYPO|nr:l-asparaginase II domain-containing protein [Hirsutella rhossiliensis]KAH0968390.1 l-asparaginase II domain-containing protein [Hirsutella rhossiliensis]
MTNTTSHDFVVSERNGIAENRHEIHAAVVDSTGRLLLSLGNPSRLTLIRSAAKPLQALAVAESGALERYGFDEADLALVCASHSSEDRHVARARAMLGKARNAEESLRCGGHPSIMPGIHRDWIRRDVVPTAVWSNCSGKHAGVLAAAKAIGADVADYHLLGHPVQARIADVVGDLSGLQSQEIQ